MIERIHSFSNPVTSRQGVRYRVHAYGERNAGGTWDGWLVFEPEDGVGAPLRTDRETTQPEREHLVYWASGLEPVYFEGALGRAHG